MQINILMRHYSISIRLAAIISAVGEDVKQQTVSYMLVGVNIVTTTLECILTLSSGVEDVHTPYLSSSIPRNIL